MKKIENIGTEGMKYKLTNLSCFMFVNRNGLCVEYQHKNEKSGTIAEYYTNIY